MNRHLITLAAAASGALCLVLPAAAHAATPPALLSWDPATKGQSASTYWYDTNGNRYVFLSQSAVASWYDDAATRSVSSNIAELSKIPLKGTVAHRPGARLLKFESDPKVYTVSRYGVLRWLTTENVALHMYGNNWKTYIDEVSVADYPNYAFGSAITDEGEYDRTDYMDIKDPSQNLITSATRAPKTYEAKMTLAISKTSAMVGQEVLLSASVTDPGTTWNKLVIRFYDSAGQVIHTCRGTVACSATLTVGGPVGDQVYTARVFNEYEQSVASNVVSMFVSNP